MATLIEFTHRATSGIAFLLVVLLVVAAIRVYAKGHPARLGAWLSLGLMVVEASLGAGLVLFHLVEDNDTVARAVAMALHLVNTLFLLAALALTAWWSSGGQRIRLRRQGAVGWMILAGVAAMVVLGASGAVTALGDTLFPATSLGAGMARDFSPTAHFLLRLRILHPILAVSTGLYLALVSVVAAVTRPWPPVRRAAAALCALFLLQIAAGITNLLLLAPVWLQLVHLLLADLVWLGLVLLAASALAVDEAADADALRPTAGLA